MALSVLVHGLLLLALTWGLNWNQAQVAISLDAEMWSAIPLPAAPKAEPEPPAEPTSPAKPEPEPKPEPAAKPPRNVARTR